MNLNHLAVVHAVATEQSVSRAADRLMVSQPAVSKQLRELEKQLGTPLFDRLPRGVRPTQAGTILADYARRIFGLAAEAEQRLAELRGLERGELRIGASTTIAVYLLPPVFVAFRSKFPGVKLTVDIANTHDIQDRLAAGLIDVAMTEGDADEAEFVVDPFMTDELIAIAAPGHPLAAGKTGGKTGGTNSVRAEVLCREPFVVREAGSGTRAVVERALSARGLAVTPVMAVGSTIVIKRAVAAGVGIAFVSRLACELELRSGTLVEIRTSDLKITRPLHRLRIRGRHEPRAVAEFDQLLKQAVADFGRRPSKKRGDRGKLVADHTAASMG
ncbi:LysR substrate-binding domain-containing protein [Humisphaera borealis]|uniref:LysR family transcriptional regulator n=1 Tax=Humisphaera borealis TaxID=2807512 RepID=A0A7M2WW02_9BACT|nr:LysR substrate-binding domain-containing protein [Humisphaera borealis]QOV89636.1 LysR family transcriptional regulator [Humisphaera borealis]